MSEFQLNLQKHVNIYYCNFNKMSIKKNSAVRNFDLTINFDLMVNFD